MDAPESPRLADLSFRLAPQYIALQEYRDTIDETERRVERLAAQLRQLTPAWRRAPVVEALQALRRISSVTAVGLVTEVGDTVFLNQLLSFCESLGLESKDTPRFHRRRALPADIAGPVQDWGHAEALNRSGVAQRSSSPASDFSRGASRWRSPPSAAMMVWTPPGSFAASLPRIVARNHTRRRPTWMLRRWRWIWQKTSSRWRERIVRIGSSIANG